MRKMFVVLILALVATLFAVPVSASPSKCRFLVPETNYSGAPGDRSWSHIQYVYWSWDEGARREVKRLGTIGFRDTREGRAKWNTRIKVPAFTEEVRITRYARSNRTSYVSYVDYWDVSVICSLISGQYKNQRLGDSDLSAYCTNGEDRGGDYDGSNGDSCYTASDLGDPGKWNTK